MNTQKFIAICIIAGAALTISQSSSAQIRLGAASTTHLTSAASLNTPSVSNALRASSAVATNAASQAKATTASTATGAAQTTAATEKKAVSGTRQIEAKTATSTQVSGSSETAKGSPADVEVKSSTSASVQKQ